MSLWRLRRSSDLCSHRVLRISLSGVVSPFLVCCCILLFCADIVSSAEIVGNVAIVRGEVVCRRPGMSAARTLKRGDTVQVADLLETGKDGKVQILLSDDTVINLMPDSILRISHYSYNRDTSRRSAVATVKQGTAHFIIYKELKEDSYVTVETEHALIQIRQADLVVVTSRQRTELYTLAGYSNIRNSSNLVVGNVTAGENQSVVVQAKTPPTSPSVIPSLQRRKFIKDARQL